MNTPVNSIVKHNRERFNSVFVEWEVIDVFKRQAVALQSQSSVDGWRWRRT